MDEASAKQPTEGSAGVEPAPVNEPKQKSDSVSYDTYQRTLSEAKAAKTRLREFEAAEKRRAEEELQKRGEFETLLKSRETDLERLQGELSSMKKRELDRLKLGSVLEAAGGEIDPKFYQLIEYDTVTVDESGEVDRTSVARVVESFKKNYPEVLRSLNPPKLPVNAPMGSASGKISRAAWKQLPSKEMMKYRPEQIVD